MSRPPALHFESMTSFLSLRSAALRAARGHRRSSNVSRFLFNLEPEIFRLQRELRSGQYRPGTYVVFSVSDPKHRLICAAPFRDRVVHHSLCLQLEPHFEALALPHSYACRHGKGSHAAVAHAWQASKAHPFFLKLDIRKYFESLPHARLLRLLNRIPQDDHSRDLIAMLVRHGAPGSEPGRGLPIGALSSQHFANFYLLPLDRHVVRKLRPGAYFRYMDDLLLFDHSMEGLREAAAEIDCFVTHRLDLQLKEEATLLAGVAEGVPFLGFRFWPGLIRMAPSRLRRFHRTLDAGLCDEQAVARSAASLIGWSEHAHSLRLRRSFFGRLGEWK